MNDGRSEFLALITPGIVSNGKFLPAGPPERVTIVTYHGAPGFDTIRTSPGGIETVARAGAIAARYGAAQVNLGRHGMFVMEVTWQPAEQPE